MNNIKLNPKESICIDLTFLANKGFILNKNIKDLDIKVIRKEDNTNSILQLDNLTDTSQTLNLKEILNTEFQNEDINILYRSSDGFRELTEEELFNIHGGKIIGE